jgi:hypothetical protein
VHRLAAAAFLLLLLLLLWRLGRALVLLLHFVFLFDVIAVAVAIVNEIGITEIILLLNRRGVFSGLHLAPLLWCDVILSRFNFWRLLCEVRDLTLCRGVDKRDHAIDPLLARAGHEQLQRGRASGRKGRAQLFPLAPHQHVPQDVREGLALGACWARLGALAESH